VKYFLEQCLASLIKAIEPIDAEVWVVDNASTDGSVDYLRPLFPFVHFISNTVNVGFAKANNQALVKCKGRYVLYLNPDTLLPEDTLLKSLVFLSLKPSAGALGIRMIDGSGTFLPESKRSFPSPLTSFYKLTGLSRMFPSSRIFGRYALAYLNQYQNHEVDVLAGAFLMANKELLVQLNGFDEAFFMYGEDIDLSFRIQKAGFKNYYFSEGTIVHFKGESTSKGSLNYVKMFYNAMSIFVKKHYRGSSARFIVFFIQSAIWLRAGLSVGASVVKRFPAKKALTAQKEPKQVVVGTEEEYHEVNELIAKAGLKIKAAGRVALTAGESNCIGAIKDLVTLVNTHGISQIVWCSGVLELKTIIALIQQLPNGISNRFHAKGTKSIVGSDSKNRSGEFIAST